MEVIQFSSGIETFRQCIGFLCKNESLNNINVGAVERWKNLEKLENSIAVGINDGSRVVGFVTYTEPYYIVLSPMPFSAIPLLVNFLLEKKIQIPGVLGPAGVLQQFLETYCSNKLVQPKLELGHFVYELKKLKNYSKICTGRWATMEDFAVLSEWGVQFAIDCNMIHEGGPERVRSTVKMRIEEKRMWVLERNQKIVSMAAISRVSPNGMSISFVYTPKEFRKQGLASQAVGEISQYAFDEGKKICNLFTDTANPTSNKIYRNLGFRVIGTFDKWRFE